MRASWKRQRSNVLLLIGALLFCGGGVGFIVQGVGELQIKQALGSATVCTPPVLSTKGSCLFRESVVVVSHLTGHDRSGTHRSLRIVQPNGQQADVDVLGSHAFNLLNDGESAQATFYRGHLLQLQTPDGKITPTWSPSRWWLHLLGGIALLPVGLFALLLFLSATGLLKGAVAGRLQRRFLRGRRVEKTPTPVSRDPEERYRHFISHVREEGVMFTCKPMWQENGEQMFALWPDPDSLTDTNELAGEVLPFYTQPVADHLHEIGKGEEVLSLWDALKLAPKHYPLVVFPVPGSPGKRVSEDELRQALEG